MKKRIIKKLYKRIEKNIYDYFISPRYFNKYRDNLLMYNVESIEGTVNKLLRDNVSIGRFGDGELLWILGKNNSYDSFEQNSKYLSRRLIEVLTSKDENFLIGLPDSFRSLEFCTSFSKKFWEMFIIKNSNKINKYLSLDKHYYNTNITRPYIDFNYNFISKIAFNGLKAIWKNKNILIVEGKDTRLGCKNDFLNDANDIKRIECPSRNSFEVYNDIFNATLDFLNKHSNYIVLISLGPTATVLSYDLFKKGYKAIDLGHADIEYDWYNIGAKEKINLSYKYVNENKLGHSALPIKDNIYYKQIVKKIY